MLVVVFLAILMFRYRYYKDLRRKKQDSLVEPYSELGTQEQIANVIVNKQSIDANK